MTRLPQPLNPERPRNGDAPVGQGAPFFMATDPSECLPSILALDMPVEAKLELIAVIIRIAEHFAEASWGRTSEKEVTCKDLKT